MKLLGGEKTTFLDYLFVFVLIIYSADASKFTRGYGNLLYFSTYIPLFFAIAMGVKNKVSISREFILSLLVFIVYWILASIVNQYLSFGFLSYWLITLTISFVVCKSYGLKYLCYFETIVFHLSVISLILWAAYLVMPNVIWDFCKRFQFSESFEGSTEVVNIIVFSLLDYDYSMSTLHLFYRNSGFSFEPGAYSCFLCLAIACNIIRNKGLKIKGNIPMIFFLASLFSTESTTGGITLILMMAFWMLSNAKSARNYVYLIVLIPLAIWIFNQDFVGEKLTNELDASQQMSYSAGGEGGTGRIMSFLLLFEEFKERPIFGLAGDPNTLLLAHDYGYSVHSGIGELLSQFGALMAFAFIVLCVKTNKLVKIKLGYSSTILFAAFIGSMVSYSLWRTPAFFILIIYGLYCQETLNGTDKNASLIKNNYL